MANKCHVIAEWIGHHRHAATISTRRRYRTPVGRANRLRRKEFPPRRRLLLGRRRRPVAITAKSTSRQPPITASSDTARLPVRLPDRVPSAATVAVACRTAIR